MKAFLGSKTVRASLGLRGLVGQILFTACIALPASTAVAPAAAEPLPPLQLALLAEPPVAETTGESPAPSFKELLKADFKRVLSSPRRLHRKGWAAVALTFAALGAGISEEHGDTDLEGEEGSHFERQVADTFEPMGAEGSLAVLGAFYLAGTRPHNRRARSVAVDGAIASLIAGGVISPVIKEALGRSRPRDSESGTDFHPFSGNASFPSGHTTQAFAVASVIATEYRSPWIKTAAYTTASLVGYARVLHDRHYVSDVVAGALLGTLVGRTVVRHNRWLRGGALEVSPILGGGNAGVAVSVHLGHRKD
jgi:membrane-associated phospholipid phosphatase